MQEEVKRVRVRKEDRDLLLHAFIDKRPWGMPKDVIDKVYKIIMTAAALEPLPLLLLRANLEPLPEPTLELIKTRILEYLQQAKVVEVFSFMPTIRVGNFAYRGQTLTAKHSWEHEGRTIQRRETYLYVEEFMHKKEHWVKVEDDDGVYIDAPSSYFN